MILYEVGDIDRFDTVQQFASYGRLVKCKAESAGKNYGTQGNKIGNAHLKWAFSEAVVCHLRGNPKAIAGYCIDACPICQLSQLVMTL